VRLPLWAVPLLGLTGCAAVAVSGATQGVTYTFTNVAYRTFTFPQAKVHDATLQALKKMQFKTLPPAAKTPPKDRIDIKARAEKLDIEIRINSVTGRTTKMSVNAKRNLVLKDKAVAMELLHQTALALGER
jgi:hypothetical protein